MNNSLSIFVVFIITSIYRQWRQKSELSGLRRLFETVLVASVTGTAAFAGSYAVNMYNANERKTAAIEKVVAQIETAPFIGAILKDYPQYKQELAADFAADVSKPGAPSTARALIVRIKKEYGYPAIWGAPDGAVSSAFDASKNLIDYLKVSNIKLCSQYVMAGFDNTNDLPEQGKTLFNKTLEAMDNAYHQGNGQPRRSRSFTDDELPKLFQIMALTPDELQAIQGKGTEAQACSAGVKVYDTKGKLRDDYKVMLARWVLTLG